MPKITRWFIKAGMIYFVLGVMIALVAEFPGNNKAALLMPVYWHLIVIGWITQVIMGVSIWMFPRRKRDRKREFTFLAVIAFITLNLGLVMRLIVEPFIPLVKSEQVILVVVILSSLLQFGGVIAYVAEIWPRLYAKKRLKSS